MRIHRRYFGLYGVVSAVFGFLILLSLRSGPDGVTKAFFDDLLPNLAFLALSCTFYGLAARSLGQGAEVHEAASSTDPHTGLPNARFFEKRLAAEESLATRHGTSLALLVIDVDGLKKLNGEGGHRAGDRALLLVAKAMADVARVEDVIARWGGDEFVILAPHTGRADAFALATRLQHAVEDLSGSRVTVSIGVAATEHAGWIPPSSLFEAADKALYQAKATGRNRSVLSVDPPESRSVTRLEPAIDRRARHA